MSADAGGAQREQALQAALARRASLWQAAATRATRLANHRAADIDEALQVIDDYRVLAGDLARARRLMPRSRTREYLEGAYAAVHGTVHRSAVHPLATLVSLFRDEIPAVVTQLRWYIFWIGVLFVLSLTAGFALVRQYPDLIAMFASSDMIASVERGELWTDGLLSVLPPSLVSAGLLTNNIVVSLSAFCVGALFGLGTFYIVALNGLTTGALFAFTAQHGLAGRLFDFILAHGCVEISVLCLSGAAGAAVGESLVRPALATRRESFQRAALESGKLLLLCILLLLGCGLIEGYLSPDPDIPRWARATVGVGYWLLMLALLRGWAFGATRQ